MSAISSGVTKSNPSITVTCETVLELLDQGFVCRASSTDRDGVSNIAAEGGVGPILIPGLWSQIADATAKHQLIGRQPVEIWIFITPNTGGNLVARAHRRRAIRQRHCQNIQARPLPGRLLALGIRDAWRARLHQLAGGILLEPMLSDSDAWFGIRDASPSTRLAVDQQRI
jgi:hypothetical protein